MPPFLGWHKTRSTPDSAAAEAEPDAASWLIQLCLGDGAPALLRPLSPTCELVRQLLGEQPAPATADAPLREACAFINMAAQPERQLELALTVHSNPDGMRSFTNSVGRALQALCTAKGLRARAPPLSAALEMWQRDAGGFADLAQEAWELHAYFVFLDVKGDRTLLESTALRLCNVLGCSAQELISRAARTERFVEKVLEMLAEQSNCEMLQQRHVRALQGWRASWSERVRRLPEQERDIISKATDKEAFWVNYFQELRMVPWADFLEAFQDFYLRDRSPVDISEQLRSRVDPDRLHRVTQSDWRQVLKAHHTAVDLVDFMLGEVLVDVPHRIYRAERLPPLQLPSAAEASAAQDGSPTQSQRRGLDGANSRGASRHSTDQHGSVKDVTPTSFSESVQPLELEARSSTSTPLDPRGVQFPPRAGENITWEDFCRERCARSKCWWNASGQAKPQQRALQAAALASVCSGLELTNRALILRIASGSLADGRPVLEMPGATGGDKTASLPALVITANDSQLSGVTRFGRRGANRLHVPDLPMGEPIASRSHFSVVYNRSDDKFQMMDAGSKWGTFVKITRSVPLRCGDWVRVGNAEMVVRYCGGACPSKRHRRQEAARWRHAPSFLKEVGVGHDAVQEVEAVDPEVEHGVRKMLNGVRTSGWKASSACASLEGARLDDSRSVSSGSGKEAGKSAQPCLLPVPPLQIDFVAGPRMGQKLTLTERVSTLGRSDQSTLQITDPMLANVSRTHCSFQYRGNRWHLSDNGSTNGTWMRFSCVLEPSAPAHVDPNTSVLAGMHEFIAEEVDLASWWLPCVACDVLSDLVLQDRTRDLVQPARGSCGVPK